MASVANEGIFPDRYHLKNEEIMFLGRCTPHMHRLLHTL